MLGVNLSNHRPRSQRRLHQASSPQTQPPSQAQLYTRPQQRRVPDWWKHAEINLAQEVVNMAGSVGCLIPTLVEVESVLWNCALKNPHFETVGLFYPIDESPAPMFLQMSAIMLKLKALDIKLLEDDENKPNDLAFVWALVMLAEKCLNDNSLEIKHYKQLSNCDEVGLVEMRIGERLGFHFPILETAESIAPRPT